MSAYNAGRYSIEILYEDNHVLVVRKPPNMPVQADSSGDLDLQNALKRYIGEKYQKPGDVFLALCHRLDRPVGGAMVLCRTSKAAERLTRQFAEHTVTKRYLCITDGESTGRLHLIDWLKKGTDGNVRAVNSTEDGAKRAELIATPLGTKSRRTLMCVELMTGRAHQIRVQLSHAGYPLWGDNRYGGGKPGQQIALWSTLLRFNHPTQRTLMEFMCEPPCIAPWLDWNISEFCDIIKDNTKATVFTE